MPACQFCKVKLPVHEMEVSVTDDSGDRVHYCTPECYREERRVATVEDGFGRLADALEQVASALDGTG